MDAPPTPDSVSRTLAAWRVVPSRSPEFRAQVWQRIGGRGDAVPWREYARRHAPSVLGAVALAMVAGGVLGHERARAHAADENARMASAYVRALDARAMSMP